MLNVLMYYHDNYFASFFRTFLSENAKNINIFFFSEYESAWKYYQQNKEHLKCILSDSEFLQAIDGDNCIKIVLSDETIAESDINNTCSLNIYQHKDIVLDDLNRIFYTQGITINKKANKIPILSFFSTQGGSGKTTMAYMTALKAIEYGKTAYINLEFAPSVQTLYQHQNQYTAEEALYALKERSQKNLLAGLERNNHGVYVLPSPNSIVDQAELNSNDIEYLLETLQNHANLDYIIIDLSSVFTEIVNTVLKQSDRVVLVYSDEAVGRNKKAYLEQDPNYDKYLFCGKELWILNRCLKRYSDKPQHIYIPVSKSLESTRDLQTVLQGNPFLIAGCEAILKSLERRMTYGSE